jgi:hypothetical protein
MKKELKKGENASNRNAPENSSEEIMDLRPVLQFLQFDGKICANAP